MCCSPPPSRPGDGTHRGVGLLAFRAAAYFAADHTVAPYPLDVLGAQTEAMIGYVIEQELGNTLPFETPIARVRRRSGVDGDHRGFGRPTKPIGTVYYPETAERL